MHRCRKRWTWKGDDYASGRIENPRIDIDKLGLSPCPCVAAERAGAGDYIGARELLMEVLGTDLRCLDGHAHLGNIEFEHSPEIAIVHYEIGIRIGELSFPPEAQHA
jgi:hypothetical protein